MAFSKSVPIQLGGKTRTLKYGFNALVDLEDTLGIPIQDLMKVFSRGAKLRDLRAILWVGLRQEEPGLTQDDVGNMIESAEDFKAIGEAIRAAMEAAFPPAEKAAKPTPKIPKN
jgi:hypothetical protein